MPEKRVDIGKLPCYSTAPFDANALSGYVLSGVFGGLTRVR